MSVGSLRSAITERARELYPVVAIKVGITEHKRNWRECPCSWCEKKREATIVIGTHVPRNYRGHYVEDMADAWRADKRREYRQAMKELEEEGSLCCG